MKNRFPGGQLSGRVRWEDIFRFNWDCILMTAERALRQGMDVVIDYVIEDEFPKVCQLARANGASLSLIVLTADGVEMTRRLRNRGDSGLTERALFLKKKLESMPENRGHLYDNTDKTPEETVREIDPDRFLVPLVTAAGP